MVANKGELVSLASAGAKPFDSHATDELAKVWTAIDENEFSKALSLLAILRAKLQDSSYYWYTTGYLHRKIANHGLAIEAYKSAIAIKPDFAYAYNNMGIALDDLGRYTEAIAAYRRAASLDPDGDTGEIAREGLRILRER